MSDNDLIRRGDAQSHMQVWWANDYDRREPSMVIDAIPAVQVTVKPLEWQSTVDGAGHDHGVTLADCPVFEKRFWAERPDKQAKIDAKRAARIRSALTTAPAPDAAKVAALVEQVKNTLSAYSQWASCASGTPEDTIAVAALFSRMNRLSAAIAALKEV